MLIGPNGYYWGAYNLFLFTAITSLSVIVFLIVEETNQKVYQLFSSKIDDHIKTFLVSLFDSLYWSLWLISFAWLADYRRKLAPYCPSGNGEDSWFTTFVDCNTLFITVILGILIAIFIFISF